MEHASFTFKRRMTSMIKVDFKRLFTTPLYYIITAISFFIPILILIMTTMMEGSTSTDPVTGEITTMQGFENVWQIIGSVSTDSTMSMDLISMCNINMMYFFIAILVCLFIADDFKSGYCKNLFTLRSSKVDYVISKTLTGVFGGISMILAFFIGAMIGGAIANVSFSLPVQTYEIFMCMLSKLLLVAVFVPIFVIASIIGKQRVWISLIGSFAISMLLFTMIPMISPLDSSIINVILCLIGGLLFSFTLGLISNLILKKKSIL